MTSKKYKNSKQKPAFHFTQDTSYPKELGVGWPKFSVAYILTMISESKDEVFKVSSLRAFETNAGYSS